MNTAQPISDMQSPDTITQKPQQAAKRELIPQPNTGALTAGR